MAASNSSPPKSQDQDMNRSWNLQCLWTNGNYRWTHQFNHVLGVHAADQRIFDKNEKWHHCSISVVKWDSLGKSQLKVREMVNFDYSSSSLKFEVIHIRVICACIEGAIRGFKMFSRKFSSLGQNFIEILRL